MTYNEFIESILSSRENKYFEHSEKHHIIPRCLGGSDDISNLVYLTYEEHFISHMLLHEENPENRDLLLPLLFYSKGESDMSPGRYAQLRREFIDSQRGENNPMYGRTWNHTEESKKKIGDSLRGRKQSEEHRKHNSESHIGILVGDRNPMRNNPEAVRKVSEALSGDKNPMYGKTGELSPLYGVHYTWMTNGASNRRASEYDIEELRAQGYREGFTRKSNRSEEATKNRRIARSRVVYTKTCKLCGREFQSRSGNARYCGCDRL